MHEDSPRAIIGEIGNQIHNLGCEHQNDENLSAALADLASRTWAAAQMFPSDTPIHSSSLQERLHKTRETFRMATPGSNEEFTAWLQGFDTATEIALKSPAQPKPDAVREAAKVLADAMEKREWTFYPIEMPVNESGYGPATVGADATSIIYEVWEAGTLRSISSHNTLPDAIISALRALAEGE